MTHSFSAMFLFSSLLYLYCCRMLNAWCLNFTSMSLKSSMRSSSVVLTFFLKVVSMLSFCVLWAFIHPEYGELLLFATVIVHALFVGLVTTDFCHQCFQIRGIELQSPSSHAVYTSMFPYQKVLGALPSRAEVCKTENRKLISLDSLPSIFCAGSSGCPQGTSFASWPWLVLWSAFSPLSHGSRRLWCKRILHLFLFLKKEMCPHGKSTDSLLLTSIAFGWSQGYFGHISVACISLQYSLSPGYWLVFFPDYYLLVECVNVGLQSMPHGTGLSLHLECFLALRISLLLLETLISSAPVGTFFYIALLIYFQLLRPLVSLSLCPGSSSSLSWNAFAPLSFAFNIHHTYRHTTI